MPPATAFPKLRSTRASRTSEPPPELVELPRDLLRHPPRERAWAYAAGRELGALRFEEHGARMLGALFVLLSHYTQRGELSLDLTLQAGTLREARGSAIREQVGASFGSLCERLAARLEALPSLLVRDAGARARVAVTFLGERAELALSDLSCRHEVHFIFHQQPSGLALLVGYDHGLFRPTSVERWLDAFHALLARSWEVDEVASLQALPRAEAQRIDALTRGPLGSEHELVARRFARVAREHAGSIALRHGSTCMRYDELARRSNQLARYLVEAGASGRAVVVCLTPSVALPVALLGCLEAGALYVPLDPSHPAALIDAVLADVQPWLALTDSGVPEVLWPAALPRLLLDRDFEACVALPDRPLSLPPVALEQDAYVIYTSGTTGQPKGVVASQRNLAHYLQVACERFGFAQSDRFCSLARYTFSISFFELLSPLLVGAELVLLDRDDVLDPARLCATLSEVTVLHAGPSLLRSLLRFVHREARAFENLRHVSSGGDLVPPDLLDALKPVFPRAELFVIYGCSEVACMATSFAVSRAHAAQRHLIGRPFAGVTVRVLDASGRSQPFGVIGELYVAGAGVARRYLNQPALSSERFLCLDGQRFYRTGDLGRLHDDGNLEILGRSDFQLQVRGMRIEASGIEATVRRLGLAQDCLVMSDEERLLAFVVEPVEDLLVLRRRLAEQLPDYMVPQRLVVLEALPRNGNGKLDRARLRELARRVPRALPSTGGASTRELALAHVFARVLELPAVGLDDDFFELGGHSLGAVLLMELLAEQLGRAPSPGLLFAHPTPRALAAALHQQADAGAGPVLLNRSQDAPPLFLLLGVQLYRELARELEGHYAVYGVYADSELALITDRRRVPSVQAFARDYVKAIRAQQPRGPYRLGGMSFGGIVAYEVAQQLLAQGERVELLLMLDSVLPMSPLRKLARVLGMPRKQRAELLGQRITARLAHVQARGPRSDDHAALASLDDARQRAYRLAAGRYLRSIRPYPAAATLLVAGERLAGDALADERCGFGALVRQLRVHRLACEHLALLQAPHVRHVCQLLRTDLRAAEGRPCLPPARRADLHSSSIREIRT